MGGRWAKLRPLNRTLVFQVDGKVITTLFEQYAGARCSVLSTSCANAMRNSSPQ
jgi:hypothetical protein